jgi:hypothetical protein
MYGLMLVSCYLSPKLAYYDDIGKYHRLFSKPRDGVTKEGAVNLEHAGRPTLL